VLLHGVTGSGKTEVYLQAIAPILASGKSALVLVPEIGLTPQLTDRFRARFGEQICVYHSALSDGERYDTWRQMLTGTPQIVIGTRSAIFAPLPHLGLIILDEEHDSSFKQDQRAPCYHARTVAKWRAELENCPLILGSATPALETFVGTRRDYYSLPNIHYLSLPDRIYSRPMPPVEIVDMRQELRQGKPLNFQRFPAKRPGTIASKTTARYSIYSQKRTQYLCLLSELRLCDGMPELRCFPVLSPRRRRNRRSVAVSLLQPHGTTPPKLPGMQFSLLQKLWQRHSASRTGINEIVSRIAGNSV
jgi:primosomal protein N'